MRFSFPAVLLEICVSIGAIVAISGCDHPYVTSNHESGVVVRRINVEPAPKPRGWIEMSLRRGIVPPGVDVSSVRGISQAQSPAAAPTVRTTPATRLLIDGVKEHTDPDANWGLDCDPNTEICLRTYSLPNLWASQLTYTGGAYITTSGTNANVGAAANLWVERRGYPMGLDLFPWFDADGGIDQAEVQQSWGGTCAEARRNSLVGSLRTAAQKTTVYPPALTTWGPTTLPVNDVCNFDDPIDCDQEEGAAEMRALPEIGNDAASLSCSGGGWGGGSWNFQCVMVQYEISYDGGVTWEPLGDPFEVCEWILATEVRIDESSVVVGQTSRQVSVDIVGGGAVDDGAFAYVYGTLNDGGRPTVVIDTSTARVKHLEAAFLSLAFLDSIPTSAASAGEVRIKIGDHRLSAVATTRAQQRNSLWLQELRHAPEGMFGLAARGRRLKVDLDDIPSVRRRIH